MNSNNNAANNNNAIMIPVGRRRRRRRSHRQRRHLEFLTLRNLNRFMKLNGHEAMFSSLVDDFKIGLIDTVRLAETWVLMEGLVGGPVDIVGGAFAEERRVRKTKEATNL